MSERDDWLEWRRAGWTSTDAARAWTGYYGGAYAAVAEKLGLAERKIDPNRAELGHALEEPLANAVFELRGWYVQAEQMLVEHVDNPRDRATIDGLLSSVPVVPSIDDCEADLEIKSRLIGADVWPWRYWTTQCQWHMHVTGKRYCMLVVAVVDYDDQVVDVSFRWIERDDDLIDQLIAQADILWADYVKRGRLPDPDDPSALDSVKQVNAEADADANETVDLDDLAADIDRYQTITTSLKAWKAEQAQLAARIRHRMGAATEAKTTDKRWRVRIGQPIRKWTDMALLNCEAFFSPDEHPDLYRTVLDLELIDAEFPELGERFKEPTDDRRLTVKDLTA